MQAESTTTSIKPTRAGFIRALPLTMPVEEVVERGREAGIVLQASDVHSARYYMRQAEAAQAAHKATLAQQLVLGGTSSTVPSFLPHDSTGSSGTPTESEQVDSTRRGGRKKAQHAGGSERARAKTERLAAISSAAKVRGKTKPMESEYSLEHQLRTLVLRLGTDRTHAVIEELTALALRIADR
jgi:hypothetical protein